MNLWLYTELHCLVRQNVRPKMSFFGHFDKIGWKLAGGQLLSIILYSVHVSMHVCVCVCVCMLIFLFHTH